MAEVKKKTVKKTTNTSKVQKVSKTKKNVSELSSDELMEQILAKKKSKSNSSSGKKKTATGAKKGASSNTKSVAKKDLDKELSNDELYELIKSKKKSTKKSSVETKKEVVSKENVNKEIQKEVSVDSKESVLEVEKSVEQQVVDNLEKTGSEKKTSDFKDNLIITREITFTEDGIDLKDKKLLKQLREAIEEFDALDNTVPKIEKKEDIEIVDTKCVDKKKLLDSKVVKIIIMVLLLIVIVVSIVFFSLKDDKPIDLVIPKKEEEVVDLRPELYEECLKRTLNDGDKTGEILLAEEELTNYLKKNYSTSVFYEDLNLGFSYSYNSDVVYYAASTIKSLDALYIYTKAAAGELDLDETMTYSKKYKWNSSKEMSKYNYGDKVSLRNLVKYAVTVSDNTAHQMLVAYIGRSELKEFGNSLGAENTLVGSDNFGNISVTDAIIYMKAIDEFINNNDELGAELKSYFIQADQNGLKFEDLGIEAAHKYGEYSYFYHDIGIVYDENPYVIAILTHEGNDDFLEIVKDINEHVYDLHKVYNTNRENVCYLEVYGS